MRICLYTGSALPKLGGQEAVVDALARQLMALGHDVTVLAPRPRLPLRPRDGELPYRVLRHPRFFSTKHLVSWYRRWLQKAHRRQAFDIIHCHDVYPTGYLAALSKSVIRTPIVITSHGGDVREGNARLVKSGMRPRFVRAIEAADALISLGRFTDEGFLRLGARSEQIVQIPNGVDLGPFAQPMTRPASLDAAIAPEGYVLFLGRLSTRKGVDMLLEAMGQVPARGGVQLVIAGSGDEQGMIERRIGELHLSDRVRLVGRVAGADKVYLLQNARCIVMPSRGWEAFPLVVLESYAAGRPVIGTRIPGIEDVVEHEETGLLVSPESAGELAGAIARVFKDQAWVVQAGEKARQRAASYGWDAIARRHVEVYQRVRRK